MPDRAVANEPLAIKQNANCAKGKRDTHKLQCSFWAFAHRVIIRSELLK